VLVRKRGIEPLFAAGENGGVGAGNGSAATPQCKHRVNVWPGNSTPTSIPKRAANKRSHKRCPRMFTAAHSHQPQGENDPNAHWWMNDWKKCGLSTRGKSTQYYEVLIHDTIWVVLKNTLTWRKPDTKGMYHMKCPEQANPQRQRECKLVVTRTWCGGAGGVGA
jgi:hypothetical protein